MKMHVTVNPGDLRRVRGGLTAMQNTTTGTGMGQVTVGRRRKLSWEKSKPIHSMHIANIMALKGHDPFRYRPADLALVQTFLDEEISKAIQDAWRTGRPQTSRIRRTLRAAAEHLAESARNNIEDGDLGTNTTKYRERKKRLAIAGVFSSKYGVPPPYGIATGRMVESFAGGWALGGGRRR